ncbi:MAG TPA: hypothetical protein VF335_02025 [Chitinivibrionales bacterium]
MKRSIIMLLGLVSLGFCGQGAADSSAVDTSKISINDLESKVLSTLMFGGSSPVSFSGEARLKLQYHDFRDCPNYARQDRSWTQANWEGNEDMMRIGMVVRANRNTVLWSKIGFQNTLPGKYLNSNAISSVGDGFVRDQTDHDKLEETATVHEDMCAGLALRSTVASFWLKMGSIEWTEASPLTIWKAQPRNVAWDFLPYEIEQPISRYYDYNIVKGAKEGRASWHKKAFNGINLESIDLPWDLYVNALYGLYERYDSGEREFIDWSNDLAYTADYPPTEAKQRGVGDSYHHLLHFRLAKSKIAPDLTVGLNYVGLNVQNDIINNWKFWQTFFRYGSNPYVVLPTGGAIGFYKEPKIFSCDVKGNINSHLEIHSDIAVSRVDTTFVSWAKWAKDSISNVTSAREWSDTTPWMALSHFSPAWYGHVKSTYGIPATLDLAFISKGFYSPLSFAAPADAFFPFGSNLVGAGKFLARGEASPYAQNMAGAVVGVSPDIGLGHCKISYGQHFQVQTARDLIFFPNRLNGQDFWSLFHSSYSRWGIQTFDAVLPARYKQRLGDESFHDNTYTKSPGPDAGGIRQDYLSSYEGFVPYEDSAEASANLREKTTIFTRSANVPQHRKYTFNLEADVSYALNQLVGYPHDFFLSLYAAINGVSTSFVPLALSQKDQLLWSLYLRFEPAIALSDKFYFIGLAGFENWKSDKAWIAGPLAASVVLCPIDYRDFAWGLGFDWEMSPRVGLHNRVKWMNHKDMNYHDNDWATPVVSLEIKMWF